VNESRSNSRAPESDAADDAGGDGKVRVGSGLLSGKVKWKAAADKDMEGEVSEVESPKARATVVGLCFFESGREHVDPSTGTLCTVWESTCFRVDKEGTS
jgi:hypothetical protein